MKAGELKAILDKADPKAEVVFRDDGYFYEVKRADVGPGSRCDDWSGAPCIDPVEPGKERPTDIPTIFLNG